MKKTAVIVAGIGGSCFIACALIFALFTGAATQHGNNSPINCSNDQNITDSEAPWALPPYDKPRKDTRNSDGSDRTAPPIPASILPIYKDAARKYGLPWNLLAGIGMDETGHCANKSTSSAGARGCAQFMPGTWSTYGVDGDGDGRADIDNNTDAIHSMANYLKKLGASSTETTRQAIFGYNHAWWYVNDVLYWASKYANYKPDNEATAQASTQKNNAIIANQACSGQQTDQTKPANRQDTGDLQLPLQRELLTLQMVTKPHHDHPGADLPVPIGTPIYAVEAGTVEVAGPMPGYGNHYVQIRTDDGWRWWYGHGSALYVKVGQKVRAGEVIALVGNEGYSTGPHLHLGLADPTMNAPATWSYCPQALLTAMYQKQPNYPTRASLSKTACIGPSL